MKSGWPGHFRRKKKELQQAKPDQKNASNQTKTRSQKNKKEEIWSSNEQKQTHPKKNNILILCQPTKLNKKASTMSFLCNSKNLKTKKI